jgi:hypothetical protein
VSILPDVHFGKVGEKPIDWRSKPLSIVDDDDDELLDVTPEDVVGILGFDPKEFEKVEKGGEGSGNWGHAGRPGDVGGSGPGGGQDKPNQSGSGLSYTGVSVGGDDKVSVGAFHIMEDRLHFTPDWAKEGLKDVVLHSGSGRDFMAGGQNFKEGGNWNGNTGIINIYDANGLSLQTADYIVSHEVGHNVFNLWFDKANAEEASIYTGKPEWFDSGGNIRPEHKEEYEKSCPLAMQRNKFIDAWKSGEDGITPYSEAWAKSGQWSETVAEMFRIYNTSTYAYPAMELRITCGRKAESLADAFLAAVKIMKGPKK